MAATGKAQIGWRDLRRSARESDACLKIESLLFLVRIARNAALCGWRMLSCPNQLTLCSIRSPNLPSQPHHHDIIEIIRIPFVTSTHTLAVSARSALLLADCCLHSCSCRTANCADAAANAQRRMLHTERFEGPVLTTKINRHPETCLAPCVFGETCSSKLSHPASTNNQLSPRVYP